MKTKTKNLVDTESSQSEYDSESECGSGSGYESESDSDSENATFVSEDLNPAARFLKAQVDFFNNAFGNIIGIDIVKRYAIICHKIEENANNRETVLYLRSPSKMLFGRAHKWYYARHQKLQ